MISIRPIENCLSNSKNSWFTTVNERRKRWESWEHQAIIHNEGEKIYQSMTDKLVDNLTFISFEWLDSVHVVLLAVVLVALVALVAQLPAPQASSLLV